MKRCRLTNQFNSIAFFLLFEGLIVFYGEPFVVNPTVTYTEFLRILLQGTGVSDSNSLIS